MVEVGLGSLRVNVGHIGTCKNMWQYSQETQSSARISAGQGGKRQQGRFLQLHWHQKGKQGEHGPVAQCDYVEKRGKYSMFFLLWILLERLVLRPPRCLSLLAEWSNICTRGNIIRDHLTPLNVLSPWDQMGCGQRCWRSLLVSLRGCFLIFEKS